MIRPTHDLKSLWSDAELPQLARVDMHTLLVAKRVLYWAGRYAAPLRDADYDREQAELNSLADATRFGSVTLRRAPPFDWSAFDRLFQMVATAFDDLAEVPT